MDTFRAILRIDECLRRSPGEGSRRSELLQICQQNMHLTGDQLYNAFRGHLDLVTLHELVSTWDMWRGVLSIRRTSTRQKASTLRAATKRAPGLVSTASR